MEDLSPVDISIRTVAVRLNDSNISSEMNGGCVNSIYIPSSSENDTQVTHFNEECVENCCINHSDISDEIRGKLNICKDAGSDLLNGCNKLLRDDVNCIDLTLNGLHKGSKLELLNSHLGKFNRTCVEQSSTKIYSQNTEIDTCDPVTNCLISETSENNDVLGIHCEQNDVNNDAVIKFLPDIVATREVKITYLGYENESQMADIMRLIQKDLSEPYSIYTYRYFIHNWPKLCFLAQDGNHCVGAIVCKLDAHKKQSRRGYIAMLAVDEKYRKRKIGSNLVLKAIQAMVQDNADEVVLETEITNKSALRLYENLGFVRDKRLFRYYLNGVDALRLKLWLR